MTLRDSPGAPAIGMPYLHIELRYLGPDRTIAALTGEALRTMDDKRIRRMLSIALGDTRRRAIKARGPAAGLHAYLALAGPPKRQIVGTMGIVDRGVRGIAYISANKGRFTVRAAGAPGAEDELMRLIDRWHALGSPDLDDLRVRITYGSTRPRAWRTERRERSFVSFDWSRAAKRP